MLAAAPPGAYMGGMTQPDNIPLDNSAAPQAPPVSTARFTIGEVVRHRLFDFRGVIFDVDPVFANSEEWYQAIPEEIRPAKDQPYYHLLAENSESSYIAYVSQQNLLADTEASRSTTPPFPACSRISTRGATSSGANGGTDGRSG